MVSAIARLPAGLHHGSAQSTRFSCEIKLINPEYYATACIFVDYGAIKSGQANLETLARGCVNRIATTTIKHPVASHYATPDIYGIPTYEPSSAAPRSFGPFQLKILFRSWRQHGLVSWCFIYFANAGSIKTDFGVFETTDEDSTRFFVTTDKR